MLDCRSPLGNQFAEFLERTSNTNSSLNEKKEEDTYLVYTFK
jgi:hypothetical protein